MANIETFTGQESIGSKTSNKAEGVIGDRRVRQALSMPITLPVSLSTQAGKLAGSIEQIQKSENKILKYFFSESNIEGPAKQILGLYDKTLMVGVGSLMAIPNLIGLTAATFNELLREFYFKRFPKIAERLKALSYDPEKFIEEKSNYFRRDAFYEAAMKEPLTEMLIGLGDPVLNSLLSDEQIVLAGEFTRNRPSYGPESVQSKAYIEARLIALKSIAQRLQSAGIYPGGGFSDDEIRETITFFLFPLISPTPLGNTFFDNFVQGVGVSPQLQSYLLTPEQIIGRADSAHIDAVNFVKSCIDKNIKEMEEDPLRERQIALKATELNESFNIPNSLDEVKNAINQILENIKVNNAYIPFTPPVNVAQQLANSIMQNHFYDDGNLFLTEFLNKPKGYLEGRASEALTKLNRTTTPQDFQMMQKALLKSLSSNINLNQCVIPLPGQAVNEDELIAEICQQWTGRGLAGQIIDQNALSLLKGWVREEKLAFLKVEDKISTAVANGVLNNGARAAFTEFKLKRQDKESFDEVEGLSDDNKMILGAYSILSKLSDPTLNPNPWSLDQQSLDFILKGLKFRDEIDQAKKQQWQNNNTDEYQAYTQLTTPPLNAIVDINNLADIINQVLGLIAAEERIYKEEKRKQANKFRAVGDNLFEIYSFLGLPPSAEGNEIAAAAGIIKSQFDAANDVIDMETNIPKADYASIIAALEKLNKGKLRKMVEEQFPFWLRSQFAKTLVEDMKRRDFRNRHFRGAHNLGPELNFVNPWQGVQPHLEELSKIPSPLYEQIVENTTKVPAATDPSKFVNLDAMRLLMAMLYVINKDKFKNAHNEINKRNEVLQTFLDNEVGSSVKTIYDAQLSTALVEDKAFNLYKMPIFYERTPYYILDVPPPYWHTTNRIQGYAMQQKTIYDDLKNAMENGGSQLGIFNRANYLINFVNLLVGNKKEAKNTFKKLAENEIDSQLNNKVLLLFKIYKTLNQANTWQQFITWVNDNNVSSEILSNLGLNTPDTSYNQKILEGIRRQAGRLSELHDSNQFFNQVISTFGKDTYYIFNLLLGTFDNCRLAYPLMQSPRSFIEELSANADNHAAATNYIQQLVIQRLNEFRDPRNSIAQSERAITSLLNPQEVENLQKKFASDVATERLKNIYIPLNASVGWKSFVMSVSGSQGKAKEEVGNIPQFNTPIRLGNN